jgi:membrane protein
MTGDPRGRRADSPTEIPPMGWWDISKRTFGQASTDNLGLIAAGVAFYGFLAFVPLLAALVLTYGLVVDPADIVLHFTKMSRLMPADVARLVGEQLQALIKTSADKKGFGLLGALGLAFFGALQGAGAIVTALNIVYKEANDRSFIKTYLINAAVTLGAVALAITLVLAASLSNALELLVAEMPSIAASMVKFASWFTAGIVAIVAFAALYRYGPSRANAKWRWLTPGSLFAAFGLLAASVGFAWYASNFGSYNATYGSLGAVVVLLMWLYISAYVVLFGAELNAEIEHQTAVDTTTGRKRPLGERDAVMADTVAD